MLLALVAVSMVSAFPLVSDAFAQTPVAIQQWDLDRIVKSAETVFVSTQDTYNHASNVSFGLPAGELNDERDSDHEDATKSFVVELTLNNINTQTVQSTFANNAGVYNIPHDAFTVNGEPTVLIYNSEIITSSTTTIDGIHNLNAIESRLYLLMTGDATFDVDDNVKVDIADDKVIKVTNIHAETSGVGFVTDADGTVIEIKTGSVTAEDKISPIIVRYETGFTDGDTATIVYTEPVMWSADKDPRSIYIDLTVADIPPDRSEFSSSSLQSRNVLSVAGNSTPTHTIKFAGDDNRTDQVGFIQAIRAAGMTDLNGNELNSITDVQATTGDSPNLFIPLFDKQAPKLLNQKVTTPNTITLTWSERVKFDPINADADLQSHRITRTIVSGDTLPNSDQSQPPVITHASGNDKITTVMFPFDGRGQTNFVTDASGFISIDKVIDEPYDYYNASSTLPGTNLEFAEPTNASNSFLNQHVTDGQSPALVGTTGKIIAPGKIEIKFNERVQVTPDSFAGLQIDPDDDNLSTKDGDDADISATSSDRRIISAVPNNADNSVVITFETKDGDTTAATGMLTFKTGDTLGTLTDVSGARLSDPDSNPNTPYTINLVDAQAPEFVSGKITAVSVDSEGPPKILTVTAVVTFSEPLDAVSSATLTSIVDGTVATSVSLADRINTADVIPKEYTATITVTRDQVGPNATGTIKIPGDVLNDTVTSQNAVKQGTYQLTAGQIPTVESAKFTGSNTLEIKFSEAIDDGNTGDWQDYITNLRVDGEGSKIRIIESLSDSGGNSFISSGDTITVKFSLDNNSEPTDPVSTGATGYIDIRTDGDDGLMDVQDVLVQPTTVRVSDAQDPEFATFDHDNNDATAEVIKAFITGSHTITIEFTEPVTITKDMFGDNAVTGAGDNRKITAVNPSADGKTWTLTVDGDAMDGDATPVLTFVTGTKISDNAKNEFTPPSTLQARDSQAPEIKSIKITDPNRITAEFTERVQVEEVDGSTFPTFHGFIVDSTNRPLSVVSPTGNAFSQTWVIDFSGPKAGPDSTGTINVGHLVDRSGNVLPAQTNYTVTAGQRPAVESAKITGPTELTVKFTEAVKGVTDANFGQLVLTDGTTAGVGFPTGTGDTITLRIGKMMPTGTTGTIDIMGITDLKDIQMHPVTTYSVEDAQNPTVESSSMTGPNEVTIAFSEPVVISYSDATEDEPRKQQAFDTLTITDDSARTITSVTPSSGFNMTYTIQFDGERVGTDATAKMVITDKIEDSADNKFVPATATPTIADKQLPILYRAEFGDSNFIEVKYSEAVNQIDTTVPYVLDFGSDGTRTILGSPFNGDTHYMTYSGTEATAVQSMMVSNLQDNNSNTLPSGLVNVYPKGDPTIEMASFTASDKITIRFSEPVKADMDDFTDLQINGETRSIKDVNVDPATGEITITIVIDETTEPAQSPVGPTATGTIDIGTITDLFDDEFDASTNYNITSRNSNDQTPPQLDSVTIMSSNADPTIANIGDTITLTFTASEAIMTPTVMINGERASVVKTSGNTWTATFEVTQAHYDANEEMTTVTFSIAYEDRSDNNGPTVTATTDDTSVSFDRMSPQLDVTIMSSNNQSDFATAGDVVTLTITADEEILMPTVTINGESIVPTNSSGNVWVSTSTITSEDYAGDSNVVIFSIEYEDVNGNSGIISATTDGTAVAMGECPDGQTIHPHNPEEGCVAPLSGNITIGLIHSSADDDWLSGQEILPASQLAVTDFNQMADTRGWTLAIDAKSTGSDADATLASVKQFKENGIDIIVGVPYSSGVSAVQTYINDNDMVLISCCSSAPQLAENDNIFRTVPNDSNQSPKLVQFITESDKDSIVLIYRNDAWGQGFRDALKSDASEGNITILGEISYTPAESYDFTQTISAAAAVLPADTSKTGIVFLGFSETAEMLASANNTALDGLVWFGSGDSATDQTILDNQVARSFAERNSFAALAFHEQANDTTAKVKTHVEDTLGYATQQDPSAYAYSSYDAVYLAGLAIDMAQSEMGDDVAPLVRQVAQDREGAVGSLTLNASGDLALDNYALWTIENGQWDDRGSLDGLGTISGTVFNDANDNGVMNAGESGIGTTVSLGNRVIKTASDGTYTIAGLDAGTHTVMVTLPSGYDGTNLTRQVTVQAGQSSMQNFALTAIQQSDYVMLDVTAFNDVNGNGVMNAGEAPFSGLLILTYIQETNMVGILTTSADGTASSSSLTPHSFYVIALPADGYEATSPSHTLAGTKYYGVEHVQNPAKGSEQTVTIGVRAAP